MLVQKKPAAFVYLEGGGKSLTDHRWHGPILSPLEERELLRLAKAGDPCAKNEIARRFQRFVLNIANEYFGPDFEDRVAAGNLGLAEALHHFNLWHLNGFAAFAEHWIRKYVRLEVRQWRRGGEAGETRAEQANPHTNWHESYNAIEGLQDDDENGNPKPGQGFIAADDSEAIDDTQRLINLRLIKIGRNLGAPRECWEVDGDPRRNGSRWPRKKVRQIRHYRPAGWQGPELPPLSVREYVKKYPTPEKHLINPPRGNASALGIIGWLAKERTSRQLRHNPPPVAA
jgi:hypothetical protein